MKKLILVLLTILLLPSNECNAQKTKAVKYKRYNYGYYTGEMIKRPNKSYKNKWIRHGKGEYIDFKADSYNGIWYQDTIISGSVIFKEYKFVGSFKHSKPYEGYINYKNNFVIDKFTGTLKDGKLLNGKLTFHNEDTFTGSFIDNEPAYGEYLFTNKKILNIDNYKWDIDDHTLFIGNYKKWTGSFDKPIRCIQSDCIYQGELKNGKPSNGAIEIYKYNRADTVYGKWSNGLSFQEYNNIIENSLKKLRLTEECYQRKIEQERLDAKRKIKEEKLKKIQEHKKYLIKKYGYKNANAIIKKTPKLGMTKQMIREMYHNIFDLVINSTQRLNGVTIEVASLEIAIRNQEDAMAFMLLNQLGMTSEIENAQSIFTFRDEKLISIIKY